jgi:hypothetical protein
VGLEREVAALMADEVILDGAGNTIRRTIRPELTREDFLRTATMEELLGEVLVRARRVRQVGARIYITNQIRTLLTMLSPEILRLKGEGED